MGRFGEKVKGIKLNQWRELCVKVKKDDLDGKKEESLFNWGELGAKVKEKKIRSNGEI